MKGLVENGYFDRIILEMRKQGFFKFAEVVIDQDDVRYHVKAEIARVTSLFFTLPGRALIVQLVCSETDADDHYLIKGEQKKGVKGYWKVQIYHNFLPYGDILRWAAGRVASSADWEAEIDKIPFYRDCPAEIAGIRWLGGGYESQASYEQYNPQAMAKGIWEAVGPSVDLLDRRFPELQVTSFSPHYCFPESGEIFWSRFNRYALRQIVTRPWGSDGLKR